MATTPRAHSDVLRLIAEAAGEGLTRDDRATATALMRDSKLFHLWLVPLLYRTVILDTPLKITQFHYSTAHITIAQHITNLLIETSLPGNTPSDDEFYRALRERYRGAHIRHFGINGEIFTPSYISWIPASHMSTDGRIWRGTRSPFFSVTHLHLHAVQSLQPFYMCCEMDFSRTFPALRVLRLDMDWYDDPYQAFDPNTTINLLLVSTGLERLMMCLPASSEKARWLSVVQDPRLVVGVAGPDLRAKWEADVRGVASMWECAPHPHRI